MEMIIPNHSICYFYYDFSVFVFIILFGSIRKIMSYRFILFAFLSSTYKCNFLGADNKQ